MLALTQPLLVDYNLPDLVPLWNTMCCDSSDGIPVYYAQIGALGLRLAKL